MFADPGIDGLGIVCGATSGNVEMLEVEGRFVEKMGDVLARAEAVGLGELFRRVVLGYTERTPSHGLHWLIRVTDGIVAGNTRLAARPGLTPKIEVMAETRGEGGWVILAPSVSRSVDDNGDVRPDPYIMLNGGPSTIANVTAAERDALHALFASFDEMPQQQVEILPAVVDSPFGRTVEPPAAGDITPGDDYEQRTSWAEILTPHGWRRLHAQGTTTYWQRPNHHDRQAISATTGHSTDGRDRLFVFSSSTPFDTEIPYTKFGAYALLNHAGNHSDAARALSAAGYGHRAPRPESTPAVVINPDGTVAEPAPIAGSLELTDDGNARLLVDEWGDVVRYVEDRGEWIRWGDTHWYKDTANNAYVMERAKDTIRGIEPLDKEQRKHQTSSLSLGSLTAMVKLAATDPRVLVSAANLDSDPFTLCTPSGVVDLRTGRLERNDPAHMNTRSTAVPVDDNLLTPRWLEFLADTFGGDADLIEFVQRLAGYSASGTVTHHVLPFLHGAGRNGKTVFLETMQGVLGDYAAGAPNAFLMDGQQQHETEIARLSGLRLVVCSEIKPTASFDEAKVKLLTGGDTLTARFMYQNHFSFVPSHHLWLMGNHQPRVSSGGGESFWRRLRLVPFAHRVPEDKQNPDLKNQLVNGEGPGILAWIVEGARKAFEGGLAEPAIVMAATKRYASEEDALARFVADRCVLTDSPTVKLDTAIVRRAFSEWCHEEGEREVSQQVLGRELRSRFGVDVVRSNGRRFYTGITLLSTDEEGDREPHWSDR